ncbi:MAG: hypothetical protein RLN76_05650 [Phycisphaeraceae bacterium]
MSSLNQPSYELPRATGLCASTGRAFEPGEAYYAVLVEAPPTDTLADSGNTAGPPTLGFGRVDVGAEAWEGGFRPERVFSFWKTHQPEPSAKRSPWVDDRVLLDLLDRLGDSDDSRRQSLRHVIALVLMRKKLLRYDGAERHEEDGEVKTVWQLTPKVDPAKGPMGKWDEGRVIEVADPGLAESDVESLIEQLGQIVEIDS